MTTCHNNPEKSSAAKINEHTSVYSLFTQCLFDTRKNKPDQYRSKNCMKRFRLDLIEHATKIMNYQKEEMISLTTRERKSYHKQKVCYICKTKKI